MSEDTALVSEDTPLVSEDTALVSVESPLVSEDTALVSVDTALVSVDTALVSENTALVSVESALVSVDTALVSVDTALVWAVRSVARGDTTGVVLGQGLGHYDKCRGLLYAFRREVPQVQLIFKDVDFPVVAQRLFPWSRLFSCSLRFSQLPYTWWLMSRLCSCFKCHRCSSECERRCIHAATSSSSSLGRIGPRSVHRPLCWERLRGILLRPGRGYAPFGDECGNFLGDPNVFVRRIICPCLYRVRSKRFCAEDRGFLSEAGQFPFGKTLVFGNRSC